MSKRALVLGVQEVQAGGENRARQGALNWVPSFPELSLCQTIMLTSPYPTLAPLVIWLAPTISIGEGKRHCWKSLCVPGSGRTEIRFPRGLGRERETPERCHPLQRSPQNGCVPLSSVGHSGG